MRSLLSAQAFFLNGEIDITLGSTDSVAIRENPTTPGTVLVVINGLPEANFPVVSGSAVTRLLITGGDDGNLIDLTGMTAAIFNNPALSIEAHGGNGADTLLGSDSLNDSMDGGHGTDSIVGNGGQDTLLGDDGNDSITGNAGNDSIDAGDGQDTVDGGTGNDTIVAGDGEDSIDGSDGTDSISGDDGADTLNGGNDGDILNGGAGNDSLDGQAGNDSIFGGSGNDTLLGGSGADSVDGQGGNDLEYTELVAGQSTILSTDTLLGGSGNDTLNGADGNDLLNGGAGTDLISGNAGNDSLLGGSGNDFLAGGIDDDTMRGQSGNDTLFGGTGADFLSGDAGDDRIHSLGPLMSLSDGGTVTEGNSGTTAVTFTASLIEVGSEAITVSFQTEDGTATAGSDYQATAGTLTFLPGETSKSITVLVLSDLAAEGAETFSVRLTPVSNAIITDDLGSATILDDDLQISINDVSQNEGNSGNTPFGFTVTLSGPSTATVSVNFSTVNSTAFSGVDYAATTGTVTFAPGVTTQIVNINVFGDAVGENNESFFVNLSSPVNGVITDLQGVATILDDDGGPLVFPPPPSGDLELPGMDDPNDAVPAGAAAFTFTDNNRWNNTSTNGGGLTQGQATVLTWGIVPDGMILDNGTASNLIARLDTIYNEVATGPNITNRTWFNLVNSVFDNFASFSGLSYVYQPLDDQAAFPGSPGVVGVRPDIRIGGRNIDGNFNVLAFNFFPNNGDMVIDTNDSVYLDTSNNSRILRNVLAHEHGHGLGFPHVMPVNQTKLMEPTLATNFDGPQEDDILATNRGYGDRNEDAPGNDTTLLATSLGIVTPTSSTSMNQVSIDDDSDIDVYRFNVPQNSSIVLTVTPTGTTYLSGDQGGPPPVLFNALTQVDLSFELLAANGTTLLAAVNAGGFGQPEVLSNFSLGIGDYFIRVTGPQNMVQMYDLSLSVTQIGAPPPTPPSSISDLSDTIFGGDGSDTVFASNGDDFISGGGGNDFVFAGGGNDSVLGGSGADSLDGQAGNDTLAGQGGNDTLVGGAGDDTFQWNAVGDGDDVVSSEDGFDQVQITATNGPDTLAVGKLGPRIQVTSGGNVLTVNADIFVVSIDMGAGDDLVTIGDLAGVSQTVLTIAGGEGHDTLDASAGVLGSVRLRLNGDAGNDLILGSVNDDTIDGGDGRDTLLGGSGNDTLFGGADNDAINGQAGDDSVTGDDGNDSLAGGDGKDTLRGGLGNDSLTGQLGDDSLDGAEGRDTLNGGDGNDSLDAGSGRDYLTGGNGDDTLDGGRNDDTILGDAGNDTIRGNHGADTIDGGTGDDTISGGDGNDTITGGDGDDLATGADGDDVLNGAAGNDTLTGGDGNDIIAGGGGSDIVLGDDGDDTLKGNGGSNTIGGGQGNDTIISLPTDVLDDSFVLSAALLAKLDLM